jgi:hypothetical protein
MRRNATQTRFWTFGEWMIKLSLALIAFVAILAIPAAFGFSAKPGPKTVARSLLTQMNSGPDGRITRLVTCERASQARHTFTCDLESVRSTHLRAGVTVTGGLLRTTWAPLVG